MHPFVTYNKYDRHVKKKYIRMVSGFVDYVVVCVLYVDAKWLSSLCCRHKLLLTANQTFEFGFKPGGQYKPFTTYELSPI